MGAGKRVSLILDMTQKKTFLQALSGVETTVPPIWLMRQAGRYLPEYRELRAKSKSFLHFCYTPDMAADATLQPIRRFGFDAAIIFSDILVIPDALGQEVTFTPGVGPELAAIRDPAGVAALSRDRADEHLAPVYAALRQVKADLPAETALIGFAGAPWTLAAYMIEGHGSRDYATARKFALAEPDAFQALISMLEEAIAHHLIRQIEAGAEAVQIFDSWAGALPAFGVEAWSLGPIGRIADRVKAAAPEAKVIAFPRGADSFIAEFARLKSIDAVSLGQSLPGRIFGEVRDAGATPQGNLDPVTLIAGGAKLDEQIDAVLAAGRGGAHVFNLGHGITPETPIAHVERLIERVRSAG